MENNKYYTPEIEEFHVGFRYEMRDNSSDFKKYTVKNVNRMGFIIKRVSQISMEGPRIRVKYLDKKDIEELGWVYDGKLKNSLFFKTKEVYSLMFTEDECEIMITSCKGVNEPYVIFNGKCKNYNELKRIMNQVGII